MQGGQAETSGEVSELESEGRRKLGQATAKKQQ